MTTRAPSPLSQMIADAAENGLRVREIICEPDGQLRLLTDMKAGPVKSELEEARERRRAAKGGGNVDGN
ncbi:MAG: hypothetical protein AAGA08_17055 [Pseudomonadota bacterium]